MTTNRKKYVMIFFLTLTTLCYSLPYLSSSFYRFSPVHFGGLCRWSAFRAALPGERQRGRVPDG